MGVLTSFPQSPVPVHHVLDHQLVKMAHKDVVEDIPDAKWDTCVLDCVIYIADYYREEQMDI